MEKVDFINCEFINEEMRYLTYTDFCQHCAIIKFLYNNLDRGGKRFYKWYVYANIHMGEYYKNLIWNYLNNIDPEYYDNLIDAIETYRVR